jgi:hypothetical protein
LFILACEANQDDQRVQILDILSKTDQEPRHRFNHVALIRQMVRAIWSQNDLNADDNIDYIETLTAIISTAPFLPLFV